MLALARLHVNEYQAMIAVEFEPCVCWGARLWCRPAIRLCFAAGGRRFVLICHLELLVCLCDCLLRQRVHSWAGANFPKVRCSVFAAVGGRGVAVAAALEPYVSEAWEMLRLGNMLLQCTSMFARLVREAKAVQRFQRRKGTGGAATSAGMPPTVLFPCCRQGGLAGCLVVCGAAAAAFGRSEPVFLFVWGGLPQGVC